MPTDPIEDPLALFADGLLSYLYELEEARQHCIRHAPTTEASSAVAGTLVVTKRYRITGDVTSYLRRRLGLSPRTTLPTTPVLVSWEARPVTLAIKRTGNVLAVTASSPMLDGLPMLPLIRATHLLRCHEMLVAGLLPHEPLRVRKVRKKYWPLQAYLLRAMRPFQAPPREAFLSWPNT